MGAGLVVAKAGMGVIRANGAVPWALTRGRAAVVSREGIDNSKTSSLSLERNPL